ncbi:DUF819 family protein [Parvicella tangerina]|uniref:DUF819 family protein n=1 Tax=Parvicella tangerina TaxID=2829795 RepID=A0A916NDW8_9FLAO|nr:DUF819 family protein [Parvicella tangerina]CAG5085864.1 hypothetical protein CRYO30217_02913 [Parvicella tangerina]
MGEIAGKLGQIGDILITGLVRENTILFGMLAVVLGAIFYTSSLKSWKSFYKFVPALLLCYLIPALLSEFNLVDASIRDVPYKSLAKPFLLPAALVLMTLGIDFQGLKKLGWRAIVMFLAGTIGVIIGGPVAVLATDLISSDTVIGDTIIEGVNQYDATWRGLSTLAGSWIGGGANQAAMLETYKYKQELYGQMVTVDIVVANLWMAVLLFSAGHYKKIDNWLKADNSAMENLKNRIKDYQSSTAKVASTTDLMVIMAIAFGAVGLSHFLSSIISDAMVSILGKEHPFASSFLWLVVLTTTIGLSLSFTKMRKYEGAGASKIGSLFIYILVAAIGLRMDLMQALDNPLLILLGVIWMIIHVAIMLGVAKLIKAPLFYVAVGSKANIGGAASAPVVASAFDPSLASVGALMAILGYAVGTYGAIACAELMRMVSL